MGLILAQLVSDWRNAALAAMTIALALSGVRITLDHIHAADQAARISSADRDLFEARASIAQLQTSVAEQNGTIDQWRQHAEAVEKAAADAQAKASVALGEANRRVKAIMAAKPQGGDCLASQALIDQVIH